MGRARHLIFRHLGVMLGHAVRRMLRRRDTAIAVAIIALPILLLLLSAAVLSGTIRVAEELFSAVFQKDFG